MPFILAINKIGLNLPQGVRPSVYEDDYCMGLAGDYMNVVQRKMQDAIDTASAWTERKGLRYTKQPSLIKHYLNVTGTSLE